MSPLQRQGLEEISEELCTAVVTLFNWRKALWLQGEVVPASEKEPEGWSAADIHVGVGDRWPDRHRNQCRLP